MAVSMATVQSSCAIREVSYSTLGKAQGSRVDCGEWDGLCHEILLQQMPDLKREGATQHAEALLHANKSQRMTA